MLVSGPHFLKIWTKKPQNRQNWCKSAAWSAKYSTSSTQMTRTMTFWLQSLFKNRRKCLDQSFSKWTKYSESKCSWSGSSQINVSKFFVRWNLSKFVIFGLTWPNCEKCRFSAASRPLTSSAISVQTSSWKQNKSFVSGTTFRRKVAFQYGTRPQRKKCATSSLRASETM